MGTPLEKGPLLRNSLIDVPGEALSRASQRGSFFHIVPLLTTGRPNPCLTTNYLNKLALKFNGADMMQLHHFLFEGPFNLQLRLVNLLCVKRKGTN
jgi:hypothetical protein